MRITLSEIDTLILRHLNEASSRNMPVFLSDVAESEGEVRQTVFYHGRKLEKHGLIGKRTVGAWITPFGERVLQRCEKEGWNVGEYEMDGGITVKIVSRDSYHLTRLHKTSQQ